MNNLLVSLIVFISFLIFWTIEENFFYPKLINDKLMNNALELFFIFLMYFLLIEMLPLSRIIRYFFIFSILFTFYLILHCELVDQLKNKKESIFKYFFYGLNSHTLMELEEFIQKSLIEHFPNITKSEILPKYEPIDYEETHYHYSFAGTNIAEVAINHKNKKNESLDIAVRMIPECSNQYIEITLKNIAIKYRKFILLPFLYFKTFCVATYTIFIHFFIISLFQFNVYSKFIFIILFILFNIPLFLKLFFSKNKC